MTLEEFKLLPPEEQKAVLADMKMQVNDRIEQTMRREMVYDQLEAALVPQVPVKKTAKLPAIPNRDEAVRRLMVADDSIEAVVTRDGVKYLR